VEEKIIKSFFSYKNKQILNQTFIPKISDKAVKEKSLEIIRPKALHRILKEVYQNIYQRFILLV